MNRRGGPRDNGTGRGEDTTTTRDARRQDRTYDRTGSRDYRRGEDTAQPNNRALDIFTRSREGRRYQNGVTLRPGGHITDLRIRRYFPSTDYVYYPYYYPTYNLSLSYYSPYSYYYDVCPPYIYRQHTYYRPPRAVYIEVPIYVNRDYRGWNDNDLNDYYLNRRDDYYDNRDNRDSNLDRAIDDIRQAFRYGNIESLVYLTDPQVRIAVYRLGKYEYSLDSSDYLDMTRDMLRTTDTIEFNLDRVRNRGNGVYAVSGKHVYRDRDGRRRTVYVSFVLERLYGRWTLTQVGTAPDRIQD